jgi:hypothetical protein
MQNFQPTQWMSNLRLPKRPLRYWDNTDKSEIQTHQNRKALESGSPIVSSLIYSSGVDEHHDRHLETPYSSILVIYNRGFLIWQDGLNSNGRAQPPGTIVTIDLYSLHELAKVNPKAKRWAGIAVDYPVPLDRPNIEFKLQQTINRIFHGA